MDWDRVELHKDTKRERSQYPAILTNQAWSIKDLLYDISRLHAAFCFYFYVCQFLLQNIFLTLINIFFLCFHSWWRFRFSCFLVPSRQRIYKKSFIFLWKIFCERKLSWTHLVSKENFIGWTKQAIPLHLAPLGSQSVTVGLGSSCSLKRVVM